MRCEIGKNIKTAKVLGILCNFSKADEIVGAHLLGPNAGETINIFAIAINQKMKVMILQQSIFTYPD